MTTTQSSAEVAGLLDRYLVGLDDDDLDDEWARGLFTGDAVVEFPMSRHEGLEGLAGYHADVLAKWERTQNLNSPAVVVVDGDRATFRANVMSTHVHRASTPPVDGEPPALFSTGTFVSGAARNTPDGWRICSLAFRLVWSSGTRPRPAG